MQYKVSFRTFTFYIFSLILFSNYSFAQDYESLTVPNPYLSGTSTVLVPRRAITSQEIGILVNDADPQSVAVASYYQSIRNIPAANVVRLNFPVTDSITPELLATLRTRVNSVLPASVQGLAITWTKPWVVGNGMSITSAFAFGYSTGHAPAYTCNQTTFSAYYDSKSTKPFTDHGIRPAMMLAGNSYQDVKNLMDRGLVASQNFPLGTGYFLNTSDSLRSLRYVDFSSTAYNWHRPGALSMSYQNSDSLQGVNNILFYLTGMASVPNIYTNQYVPGAVADHLTSYGGVLSGAGQMTILEWLKAGATGSYGTVVEPCAYGQKFPTASVLVQHYFAGETLLEAYWKSVRTPGQGLFVGDPLARPWGTYAEFANGKLDIYTTILKPGETYNLASASSLNGTFYPETSGIASNTYKFNYISSSYIQRAYRLAKGNAPIVLPPATPTPTRTPVSTLPPFIPPTPIPTRQPTVIPTPVKTVVTPVSLPTVAPTAVPTIVATIATPPAKPTSVVTPVKSATPVGTPTKGNTPSRTPAPVASSIPTAVNTAIPVAPQRLSISGNISLIPEKDPPVCNTEDLSCAAISKKIIVGSLELISSGKVVKKTRIKTGGKFLFKKLLPAKYTIRLAAKNYKLEYLSKPVKLKKKNVSNLVLKIETHSEMFTD